MLSTKGKKTPVNEIQETDPLARMQMENDKLKVQRDLINRKLYLLAAGKNEEPEASISSLVRPSTSPSSPSMDALVKNVELIKLPLSPNHLRPTMSRFPKIIINFVHKS